MMIQEDLSNWKVPLRELVGAGEPLNPEVIEQVERALGIRIHDGFGQTETTAQIGNPPGQSSRVLLAPVLPNNEVMNFSSFQEIES